MLQNSKGKEDYGQGNNAGNAGQNTKVQAGGPGKFAVKAGHSANNLHYHQEKEIVVNAAAVNRKFLPQKPDPEFLFQKRRLPNRNMLT